MRAIAILAVVFTHSLDFLLRLQNVPYIGKAISFAVDHVHTLGAFGVELFFVLSGFLIGGILIRTFVGADTFTFSAVKNFWIRRWFRTLPNYWLVLTITIIVYKVKALDCGYSAVLDYFFLQNVWHYFQPIFYVESWSLSVEEWFYLTLPLALYVTARIARPTDKQRFLLRVFMGYLLVFIIIRFINAFQPINGPDQEVSVKKVVLFRLDAVMYGVLFAYLNYYKSEVLYRIRKPLVVISIGGVAFLYFLISKRDLHFTGSPNAAVRFVSDAFLYLFLPLFFSLCLPFANSLRSISSKALSRGIQHISKISYSMYLINYALVYVPFFYPMKIAVVWVIPVYLLYWITVIGLSSLLYKYFEYPVMQLRERFSR